MSESFDPTRAFGALDRLYGAGAADRLARAHLVVVGVGGVGSWAVEALARSGVGALTLIDADHLAESNLNRQLPALLSTLGAAKTEVLKHRIADINPTCKVHAEDEFLASENLESMIPTAASVVVDCIDAPRVKAALIGFCQARGQHVIVCGAAGGKTEPSALTVCDIALCTHDPLLAAVRSELRRRYFFAKKGLMNVPCVSSAQARIGTARSPEAGAALACAGYGSSVMVTATMGFIAANAAIESVLGLRKLMSFQKT